MLGWSKTFAVRSIQVGAAGNESIVLPLIVPKDIHLGMPMARVSAKRIATDLSSQTWIDHISVSRGWFSHRLRISITEHRAIAQYVDEHGAVQYFDSQGISFTSPNPPSNLPTITFSDQTQVSRAAVALFLASTPMELLTGMTSLSVDGSNDIHQVTSVMGHQGLVISWGGASELSLKTRVLLGLLALPENKKITQVDLTTPQTPIVRG